MVFIFFFFDIIHYLVSKVKMIVVQTPSASVVLGEKNVALEQPPSVMIGLQYCTQENSPAIATDNAFHRMQ